MGRTVVCKPQARLIIAILAIVGSTAALGPARAGGSSVGGAPLPVYAASLKQQGQQLVWHVELATPFSPGALAKDGRTLCLLIEPRTHGGVAGRICISSPDRRSRTPRLLYTPLTGQSGPARVIAAIVTRSSDRELTASFMPAAVRSSYAPLRWQVISTLKARACLPPTPSPGGCSVLFPPKPALVRLHEPQLVGCVPSGPAWVFHGSNRAREIALTFDDGPWYDTARFVDVLAREHAVATFFQIGDQISQYAQDGLDQRMLRDGDMIGDHTWNHADVAAGGSGAAIEISSAAAAIRRATGGFQPCLFRAPGGNVTPRLLTTAHALGFTTIQWDIDPRDWATPGTTEIYDNVVGNAHGGAIVIQHDGGGNRSETLAALPLEIHTLRREGYRFVTVTELLGYRLVYR
ncbi:MAG: polysaccharide deacetylase family protein [Solirubrobacterales bacterium]|nr:polysaccharide deacetylase family protein [Solirubrobacterales bacterium]